MIFTDRNPNRTVLRTSWAKGDFVGKVIATDPDTAIYHPDYLIYTIRSGNSNYNTFGFGIYHSPNSIWQWFNPPKDTTGNLYVRSINGIYKSNGSFRYSQYDLIVRVTNLRGLWAEAHIYVIIDPNGQITLKIESIPNKNHNWSWN